MKPILEVISREAGWLFLVFEGLCKQQNSGVSYGSVHATKELLYRHCKYSQAKMDSLLHELGEQGLVSQEVRGTWKVHNPPREWLSTSESKPINRTKPPLTRVPKNVEAPLVEGKVYSTNGNTVTLSTIQLHDFVKSALRRLGLRNAAMNVAYCRKIEGVAKKLFAQGYNQKQMMQVVQWANTRRMQGDRFPAMSSLYYLWGQNFPALLDGASAPVGTGIQSSGLAPEEVARRVAAGTLRKEATDESEQNTAGSGSPAVEEEQPF